MIEKRAVSAYLTMPLKHIAALAVIAVLSATVLAAPVSAQVLMKKGQIVTLKIPFELLDCVRAEPPLVCAAVITGSDGSLVVNRRADWETCCFPSLLEFEVGNIEYPKAKPKLNQPTVTYVSLGSIGSETGLVTVNFYSTILNIEAAFAQLVSAGPPNTTLSSSQRRVALEADE